ncbi:MAG TPA: hypothetical protein GX529_01890 [Firmicutes bacterium]|nr:hypothetical protein [Candidatus Fermentithermobacillaceae bacterium]
MNKPQMWIVAISPFVFGYLLNYVMLEFNWYGAIITFISALFYLYWFFAGRMSANWTKSRKESILVGNSFAILSYVLLMFQVVSGNFFSGIMGIAPQMFYLPALRLAAQVENILLFFHPTRYLWSIYSVAFMLMIAVYYAGYLRARPGP